MHRTDAERIHELLMDLVRGSGLLQSHPLSVSQALALHELDTDTPLSQRDLGERLQLEKSSVSRLAAVLERKNLLVRERDPDNRRQYRLRLTERGRAMHRQMATMMHGQYEQWVAALTQAERTALLKGLPALVRAIRQHSAANT